MATRVDGLVGDAIECVGLQINTHGRKRQSGFANDNVRGKRANARAVVKFNAALRGNAKEQLRR